MISLKTGDTKPLDRVLARGGQAIDLTGASVLFTMRLQTGEDTITGACEVIEPEVEGGVRYEWAAGQTEEPGLYYAEWEITYASGEVETWPDGEYQTIRILDDL